jgi:predicted PurR-regulated permease PerM
MKPFVKIALFVVFFLALAGILAALILFNKQHKDLLKIKPDYIITAVDLQKAFEDNEAAANINYLNKVLEVSGTIESVKIGVENILSLTLETGSDFSAVICTFPAGTDPSEFSSGKPVTLRGECSGFLMDVLLNNCVIIK